MTKLLDKLIVLDLEATCWNGYPPEGQMNEIIEIGVCLLDVKTKQRQDKRSLIIKPKFSTVSEFCTQLTTLTQEDVNNGISLEEAMQILKNDYKIDKRIWCSYGDYDRVQIYNECQFKHIEPPFGKNKSHLNVKSLFAIKQKLSREIGMEKALNLLQLPLEGIHHRGSDDSWNIALILSKIF